MLTRIALVFALVAAITATAFAQESGFYFRSGKGLLFMGSDAPVVTDPEEPGQEDEDEPGEEDPGEEEPGDQDPEWTIGLGLDQLPSEVFVGEELWATLTASGGSGEGYVFTAEGLPPFMELQPDGTLSIFPIQEDVGVHSGIVFTVTDGTETDSASFSITVKAPGNIHAAHMPATIMLGGTEVSRELMYDGLSGNGSSVSVTGGQAVEYTYSQPIVGTGAYIFAQGTSLQLSVEAFVSGQWVQVAFINGGTQVKRDLVSSIGAEVTSDRWRLKRTTGTNPFTLHEFRPGPAPAHVKPSFVTKAGYIGPAGGVYQIEAVAPPSAYTDEPFLYSFAPGTTVPAGITLSPEGELDTTTAELEETFNFTVVVTDGVGFKTSQNFSVTRDVPSADGFIAKSVTYAGVAGQDYRRLYDGLTPTANDNNSYLLNGSKWLVLDFGFPVLVDRITWASNKTSAERMIIEYFSDGQWLQAASVAGNGTFDPVAGQLFRFKPAQGQDFNVTELRLGSGPAHNAPSFAGDQTINIVADPYVAEITASVDTTYDTAKVTFSLADGEFPNEATLHEDGTIDLPSSDDAAGGSWTFTVRATDDHGFWSERTYYLNNLAASTPANTVMVAEATYDGSAVDRKMLYDGQNVSAFTLTNGKYAVFDYGQYVSFSDATLRVSSGSPTVTMEYLSAGRWVLAKQNTLSGSSEAKLNAQRTIVAQKVRLSASSSINVSEFRLGSGPVHQAPTLTKTGFVTALDNTSPKTFQIAYTAASSPYTSAAPTFTLKSGTLPPGADLAPSGLLSLPSAADAPGVAWSAEIEVKDEFGFGSSGTIRIGGGHDLASQTLPLSVTLGGATSDWKRLYDGTPNETHTVTSSVPLIIDFGKAVGFDSVWMNLGSGASIKVLFDLDGQFVELASITSSSNSDTNRDMGQFVVTKRVKIEGVSNSVIRELRIGNGPAYLTPQFVTTGWFESVGTNAKTVQVSATATSHYAPGPVTYQMIGGSLPNGASLNTNGSINLPGTASAGGYNWKFRVRATDSLGHSTEEDLYIGTANMTAASGKLPTSLLRDSTELGSSGIAALYDTASTKVDLAGQSLTFDFGTPVNFNDVRVQSNDTPRTFNFEVEIGGTWAPMFSFKRNATGEGAIKPFGDTQRITAQKVRVSIEGGLTTGVRTLKFGVNGSFPTP